MKIELGNLIADFFPGNLTPAQKRMLREQPELNEHWLSESSDPDALFEAMLRMSPPKMATKAFEIAPVMFARFEAGLVVDIDLGGLVLLWQNDDWIVVSGPQDDSN